jgi:hypothetical protein
MVGKPDADRFPGAVEQIVVSHGFSPSDEYL